jgi:type II secretory pathway component GspD/PulD (secretin)
MTLNKDAGTRRRMNSVSMFVGFTLTVVLCACNAYAQTAESKPAEAKPVSDIYQTIYLTNATQQHDADEVQTSLRNMLPRAKIYYAPASGALLLRGTAEDIQLAQKIIVDLDKARKTYRLTYTITESDGGKRGGAQRFTLVVVPGGKASLKQGNRVPIVTGSTEAGSSVQNTQVQYLDVGLNIDASLEGSADGLRLRSKIEQSGVSEEKSGLGVQDPVVRQSTVEGTSVLVQGKPLILGSLDVPGSTRHLEIEVVSEVVK